MNSITDKVCNTVSKYNMINDGDSVLVGFSGGADSLFLILSLVELSKKIEFKLYAAHLNHGIRGDEALRDENFVREFCENNNITIFFKTVDIPEISRVNKISEETAGRNERYRFFNEICAKNGIHKIAVAHNMNDSVETIIHNMIRGASLNGLCGIKPVNKNIIRPIIEVTRDEIELFLKQRNQLFCIDSTNSSDIYTRNKIRNTILKDMSEINSSVVKTMYFNSLNLINDEAFLNEYAKSLHCISFDGENVIIDKNVLNKQHISIKGRIIMQSFEMLKGNCESISSNHIDIICNANSSGRVYNMPDGIDAVVSYDKILLKKRITKHIGFEYNSYNIGEKLEYYPGMFLKSSFCKEYTPDDINALYIDADILSSHQLTIRSRREGDRFIPFGMKETKKLKRFFADLKIPSYIRDDIPIVIDNDQIVCVLPYRISDSYKVSKNTKNIIKFEITKEK